MSNTISKQRLKHLGAIVIVLIAAALIGYVLKQRNYIQVKLPGDGTQLEEIQSNAILQYLRRPVATLDYAGFVSRVGTDGSIDISVTNGCTATGHMTMMHADGKQATTVVWQSQTCSGSTQKIMGVSNFSTYLSKGDPAGFVVMIDRTQPGPDQIPPRLGQALNISNVKTIHMDYDTIQIAADLELPNGTSSKCEYVLRSAPVMGGSSFLLRYEPMGERCTQPI